jgi:hypothetical protein
MRAFLLHGDVPQALSSASKDEDVVARQLSAIGRGHLIIKKCRRPLPRLRPLFLRQGVPGGDPTPHTAAVAAAAAAGAGEIASLPPPPASLLGVTEEASGQEGGGRGGGGATGVNDKDGGTGSAAAGGRPGLRVGRIRRRGGRTAGVSGWRRPVCRQATTTAVAVAWSFGAPGRRGRRGGGRRGGGGSDATRASVTY